MCEIEKYMAVEHYRKKIMMPRLKPVQYPIKRVSYIKRIFRWTHYTRYWRMLEDWYFELYTGDLIMIPKDFEFDGASIPRIFRNIMSPVGPLFLAGIIHDYAYRYNKLIGVRAKEDNSKVLYGYCPGAGRAYWDDLFRRIAIQTSGLKSVSWIVWCLLRIFGFVVWKKRRKAHHPSMFIV